MELLDRTGKKTQRIVYKPNVVGCGGGIHPTFTHLETVKEVIELLRGEVPCQLGQEVVDVLHNGLMLTSLRIQTPNPARLTVCSVI